MFESVRGTIIGTVTRRIELYSPRGTKEGETDLPANCDDVAVRKWAASRRGELLDRPTGNGDALRNYPEVVEAIYGKGEWEIRIRD